MASNCATSPSGPCFEPSGRAQFRIADSKGRVVADQASRHGRGNQSAQHLEKIPAGVRAGRELIGEHRFDMPPLKARERHIAVRFAKVLEDAAPLALCLGRKTCKG
jgi:hypothetical protein